MPVGPGVQRTRPPAVASRAMAASSQPLATLAALRMLAQGGNAADAALAAAAVLCVAEPMSTGIGGDLFALVWRDGEAGALDSAGPAPASVDATTPVAEHGPRSVTVPGTVAGWAELAEKHGRRGLGTCLDAAIQIAERGYAIGATAARLWSEAEHVPAELGPAPRSGDVVRLPELAATLRRIAADGPSAFYRGPVAEAIAAVTWLQESDLAGFAPRWVEPLRLAYRGVEVLELPQRCGELLEADQVAAPRHGPQLRRRMIGLAPQSRGGGADRVAALGDVDRGSEARVEPMPSIAL